MRCALLRIAAIGAFGLAAAGGASAQSTWDLSNSTGCTQNAGFANDLNNSWRCVNGGGQAVTLSAWSSDRGVNSGGNTQYFLSGSGFASAFLSPQGTSGFGGTSRTEAQSAANGGDTSPLNPASPNHAFDAVAPGSMDMLLLDFGSASVVLDKIGIGWAGSDSDLIVMRWTGATPPPRTNGSSTSTTDGEQNLASTLWSSASPGTAGWQLVGAYNNLLTDSTTPFGGAARNTGATAASSWWLIASFNTALNGGTTNCKNADGSAATCDVGDDSFKFNFIAISGGTPPTGVPTPATLALAASALLAMAAVARRRRV